MLELCLFSTDLSLMIDDAYKKNAYKKNVYMVI